MCSSDLRAPIKIAVNHKGKTAFIPTNVYISEEHWDKTTQKVISKQAKWHGLVVDKMLMEAEEALYKLQYNGQIHDVNATELRDMIVATMNGEEPHKVLFVDHYKKVMNSKQNKNTRKMYEFALKKVQTALPNVHSMTFDDFTKETIKTIISNAEADNTKLSILCRIGSVFNDAIDNGITTNYPLRKIRIKRPTTKKRSLTLSELQSLFAYQSFATDMFKLSFFLCGMNTADMFYCLYPTNGRVEYNRQKTKPE